jgi:pyrophosphate--fructose-6-phosphate 1-phosphotransferase
MLATHRAASGALDPARGLERPVRTRQTRGDSMTDTPTRSSLQTPLETARLHDQPVLGQRLQATLQQGWAQAPSSLKLAPEVAELFPQLGRTSMSWEGNEGKDASQPATAPLRCGVVFSGGPAAGGHNVIWGLWQSLKTWHPESALIGFENGPGGILKRQCRELTETQISEVRNQGGFDLLGSGRTKIETTEQLDQALSTCSHLRLDGLVIIGGDDSNTNAALLAERALHKGQILSVVGVPKTIDGDLRSQDQPISFGFDTATKVYSELIGNIARDARSSRKYTHFIKLMGRSASHVTLECALQTQPNLALIGEELAASQTTLSQVVEKIVDWFIGRQAAGQPYGVILVPEGCIEFLADVGALVRALNRLLAQQGPQEDQIAALLPPQEASIWKQLPGEVRGPLLAKRDPHGNVPLSALETERLLALLVERALQQKGIEGFSPAFHFLGYEGRCALPTEFDATYCYGLGWLAGAQIAHGLTGTLTAIRNPAEAPEEWAPVALPLVRLMEIEERNGKQKPVITKSLVSLSGAAFQTFAGQRRLWAETDSFRQPGPIQYYGGRELTWRPPMTLLAEEFRA